MKRLIALALAAGIGIAATAPADAAQGCGRGGHRGYHGRCIPNRYYGHHRPGERLVIGHYYGGRGYWDGRRYYHHRERFHGGWRYR